VLPTLIEPKLWVRGVQANIGDIPVTASPFVVVEVDPPTVQERLKVAVLEPVPEGVDFTITVQFALFARLLVPQLSV
jgi:hypothetical protein